jgi:pre-mRNA-splicing factor ATP-dependent RNA helicase DHX16
MDDFTWVSDKFLSLTGISEPTIVDYIIACAQQSKSVKDLEKRLSSDAQLDTSSQQAVAFLEELYARLGKKPVEKKQKPKIVEKSFELVEMVQEKPRKKPKTDAVKIESKKKKRKIDRETKAKNWEILDAEEDFVSEHEETRIEKEDDIDRDLRERDEFSERLREKDIKRMQVRGWLTNRMIKIEN